MKLMDGVESYVSIHVTNRAKPHAFTDHDEEMVCLVLGSDERAVLEIDATMVPPIIEALRGAPVPCPDDSPDE